VTGAPHSLPGNVQLSTANNRSTYLAFKRLFDIVCAGAGILILLPVGLLIGVLIKLSDWGPMFYTQTRIGQFGRPFRIRKFRSMGVNADKVGLPVTQGEDRRITRIGRWLRRMKLDELPQLWNVLVGDMSFVGPRPEVPRYVERYTPEQREILEHKPGITDMATMLFRNEETLLRGTADVEQFYIRYCLPKKIELNRQYALRASVVQDLWIILQTLCPYWLGLLAMYTSILTASLWLGFLLRFDFPLARLESEEFKRVWPWMVVPQIALLFWRGQFRGLMSYFSIPELRQTSGALGLALVSQFVLLHVLPTAFPPGVSILVLDFILSLVGVCGIRLCFRLWRERYSRTKLSIATAPWRVAIIGAGDTATKLAQDLGTNDGWARRVVAFFDDDPRTWHKRPYDIPVVGMPECLLSSEWKNQIDEVIVALSEENPRRVQEIGVMLKDLPLKVSQASAWPVLQPLSS
jgi:lipopolysaccharide/colanic/teichoic acid biosynthesis glycosyltransferase